MADAPISGLTQFTPESYMLIPVVDPTASFGLKNGYITLAALQAFFAGAGAAGGSSGGGTTSTTRSLNFHLSRNSNNLSLF